MLLVYLFLGYVAPGRSRVHGALDRVLGPALKPLRRVATIRGFDAAPLLLATILQCVAFVLGRRLP
ncbi:MAG: YggT family protein [Candidatus Krumholzibacteriota bacterium]|nr:YggT family protein [Candidatus Krumholzibacteriota bacterium]